MYFVYLSSLKVFLSFFHLNPFYSFLSYNSTFHKMLDSMGAFAEGLRVHGRHCEGWVLLCHQGSCSFEQRKISRLILMTFWLGSCFAGKRSLTHGTCRVQQLESSHPAEKRWKVGEVFEVTEVEPPTEEDPLLDPSWGCGPVWAGVGGGISGSTM